MSRASINISSPVHQTILQYCSRYFRRA